MSKITIIGAGNVGVALARNWSSTGHAITIGARNPDSPKLAAIREEFPSWTVVSIAEAVSGAEVILVATPPEIAVELSGKFGDVKGKIIIDATNAVRKAPEGYPTAFHAFADLTQAEVVKCFNTTGFENMADPKYTLGERGTINIDMFMAGDSSRGKEVARQLSLDAGFAECYDFGGTDKVQLLEKFALSWINLAIFQGMGRKFAFKVLHR